MAVATAWQISGRYFESCNCDAICPCRRVDGVTGGRSTRGECLGILTWQIDEGAADGTNLAGLRVALAFRYDDDVPGSPWEWILYLDARGSFAQRAALEEIFTGRLGGDAETHFPWAWKASNLVSVRPVELDVDHTPHRQWLRVRDAATVTIRDRYPADAAVTCAIPGHDRDGEELVVDELLVKDGPLTFFYSGKCGYAATFAYSGG